MTVEQHESYPRKLRPREMKVRQKILVASFLNPQQACKREIGRLFLNRWYVELDLQDIKTTLGINNLRCKSPEMCEKELWVYMLAYNLIRLLMEQAAADEKTLPRQISFKHTLQVWVTWSQRQLLTDGKENTAALFTLVAQIRVGSRPGRIEPRATKRRPIGSKGYESLDANPVFVSEDTAESKKARGVKSVPFHFQFVCLGPTRHNAFPKRHTASTPSSHHNYECSSFSI